MDSEKQNELVTIFIISDSAGKQPLSWRKPQWPNTQP